MEIKEKAKKFWEENKKAIIFGCVCASLAMAYYYGGKAGEKYLSLRIDNAFNKIAEITPELTVGDLVHQCATNTFDAAKYK